MTTGDSADHVAEVSITDGAQTIRVQVDANGLLISNGTRWQQRLTREEAWRLAEAIEAVASRAPDP